MSLNKVKKQFTEFTEWPLYIFLSIKHKCFYVGYVLLCLYLYIYILSAFTEQLYSKPLECNVIYTSIITLSLPTSHDIKWRQNIPWFSTIWLDVNDAFLLLVEKLRVTVFLLQF